MLVSGKRISNKKKVVVTISKEERGGVREAHHITQHQRKKNRSNYI